MCVAATINKFLTLGYEGLQHHYYIFCSCHFSIQHLVLASNTETYTALNCELELNRSKFIFNCNVKTELPSIFYTIQNVYVV